MQKIILSWLCLHLFMIHHSEKQGEIDFNCQHLVQLSLPGEHLARKSFAVRDVKTKTFLLSVVYIYV